MSDIREAFEKWYKTIEKEGIPNHGFQSITEDVMFMGWQTCAKHYKATINTLNDAINEDKILSVINAQLEAKIIDLEKQLAEARALIVEQYQADKDLYDSTDAIIAIDYEPMLTRHDKSFEALGNYVKSIINEGEK